MNNLNATAAIPGLIRDPRDGANDGDDMSTSTHRSCRSDSTHQSKSNNDPPPVRLDGVFTLLRPAVASQRPQFAKVIVDSSRTMLRLDRDIRTRLNTLAKFSSSYFDKDDLDDNDKPREKPFIPISLRTKLVLNSSALVQNDDRLNDEFTAITTARREAIAAHEEFKVKAAASMKTMAEAEINARKKLLSFEYTNHMFLIAEGLAVVGKNQPGRSAPTMTTSSIAGIACLRSLIEFSKGDWASCRFLKNTENATVNEFIDSFVTQHRIDPRVLTNNGEGQTRADIQLISHVKRKLGSIWPDMTTNLWAADIKRDAEHKMDAELSDLFNSKATVDANNDLENALDKGADATVGPLIAKEIAKQLGRRASNAKKSLRKKSSGNPKNQGSTPENSGHSGNDKSNARSKTKKSKSQKRSQQSSGEESDDAVSSVSSSGTKKRGRSKSRQPPPSILKKPKVTFKKTTQSSSTKSRSRSTSKKTRRSQRDTEPADNQDGSNKGERNKGRKEN
jgi:hypothetical protein